MKTGAVAVAAATVAALSSTMTAADTCETSTLVFTLLPLLSDANQCATETGYTLYPFSGIPTVEQLVAICGNPTCTGVLSAAVSKDLPDCTIDYEGAQLNVKEQLTAYATTCGVARK
ncbi:hypothetical protein BBJ28_00012652 [Nothophytophthora sp. Chile5]|nr:hypothetical protein BBJ28_00012652 [Nothophytophthora sp. Chile5]